jgi:hypothetical protein
MQYEEPRGKWYSKIIDSPLDRSKKKEWLVICRSFDSKDSIVVVDIKNTLSNY